MRRALLLPFAGLLLCAAAARGQHPDVPLHVVDFTDLRGLLSVSATWHDEDTRIRDTEWENTRLTLIESIQMSTRGSILHDRFLTFDVSGRIGALQESWIQGVDRQDLLWGYAAGLTLFPRHKISLALKGSESFDALPGYRIGTVRNHTRQVWASLNWKYRALPGAVGGGVNWRSQEFYSRETSFEKRTAFLNLGHAFEGKDWWAFRYRYDETWRDVVKVHLAENQAELQRSTSWGKDIRKGIFFARLLYRDRHVDAKWEEYRIETRLNHRTSKSLWAHWNAQAFRERVNGLLTTSSNAGLHHRLYESLDTFIDVGGSTHGGSGYWNGLVSGSFRMTYRKRTLLGATLESGYGVAGRLTVARADGTSAPVFDESHTLTLGVPVSLDRDFADLQGVVVTSPDGSVTYVEGVDYTVAERSNRVEIERLPGSTIPDGTAVLVDYLYDPFPDSRFGSVNQTAFFGWQAGRAMRVRYSFRRDDHVLLAGHNPQLREEEAHRLDVGLQRGWAGANVFLGRLVGGWNPQRYAGASLSLAPPGGWLGTPTLNLSAEKRWLEDPNWTRFSAKAVASLSGRPHARARTAVRATVDYLEEEGSLSRSLVVSGSFDLTWTFGDWTAGAVLRAGYVDRTRYNGYERLDLHARLSLSRRF